MGMALRLRFIHSFISFGEVGCIYIYSNNVDCYNIIPCKHHFQSRYRSQSRYGRTAVQYLPPIPPCLILPQQYLTSPPHMDPVHIYLPIRLSHPIPYLLQGSSIPNHPSKLPLHSRSNIWYSPLNRPASPASKSSQTIQTIPRRQLPHPIPCSALPDRHDDHHLQTQKIHTHIYLVYAKLCDPKPHTHTK